MLPANERFETDDTFAGQLDDWLVMEDKLIQWWKGRQLLDCNRAPGRQAVQSVAKLAEVFQPKKITYATIEYVDIGGLQKDREKNSASLVPLREADALAHVVRLFEDPAVPHQAGSLDAMRDIESVDIELILTDLEQGRRQQQESVGGAIFDAALVLGAAQGRKHGVADA